MWKVSSCTLAEIQNQWYCEVQAFAICHAHEVQHHPFLHVTFCCDRGQLGPLSYSCFLREKVLSERPVFPFLRCRKLAAEPDLGHSLRCGRHGLSLAARFEMFSDGSGRESAPTAHGVGTNATIAQDQHEIDLDVPLTDAAPLGFSDQEPVFFLTDTAPGRQHFMWDKGNVAAYQESTVPEPFNVQDTFHLLDLI